MGIVSRSGLYCLLQNIIFIFEAHHIIFYLRYTSYYFFFSKHILLDKRLSCFRKSLYSTRGSHFPVH